MHYHEAARFLFDLRRFSISPGTEGVEALLDHLGNPEETVPFVQIAGSNGKGSTARMVESILREAGLSVGLYTSPHLESLSERIRVDDRPITDEAVTSFIEDTKPWLVDRAADGKPLTFFEVVTAMAIHDFARREVDVAVLEVGLGGEYDATSAVDPVATAVTNVSLEHTSVLGDTVAEIARTKSRIAAGGAPLVTACRGEALDVVREVAADAGAPVSVVAGPGTDDDVDGSPDAPALTASYEGRVSPTDAAVVFDGERTGRHRIPLVGEHQATNAAVATALVDRTFAAIGNDETRPDAETDPADAETGALDDDAIADGLARATWPGRFEVMGTDPLVVLDGAHNPAAAETLAETLATYEYDDLHLVYAAMHDKDHAATLAALPDPDRATTCRPDLDRAEDPEVLATAVERAGVEDVTVDADVAEAFIAAHERAAPGDCVLLVGSLFAVSEARSTYTRTVTPKSIDEPADVDRVLADARVAPDTAAALRDGIDERVLTVRLRPDAARSVQAATRIVGGECVGGGAGLDGGELVPVTLAATVTEYRALRDRLAAEGDGLRRIASDLAERLGLAEPADSPRERTARTDEPAPDVGDDYPWADRTAVMGVLNVTPDSFHDGGRHEAFADAVAGAERMVSAGADIIDVGGESTRPGADPVPVDEEIDRVVPVIEAVNEVDAVASGEVLVSVDTRKAPVAEAALEAGADIINDVTGLEDPAMREVVADAGCPVVVMHSIDAPVDPNNDPEYGDVVTDVIADLQERLLLAEKAGIDRERVIVDPGLGFGKSDAEDFDLLGRAGEFTALDCPVLIGHSHKSMFAALGRESGDRQHATVAATAVAAAAGADIVRVHDVAENRAAVDVVAAATDPDSL